MMIETEVAAIEKVEKGFQSSILESRKLVITGKKYKYIATEYGFELKSRFNLIGRFKRSKVEGELLLKGWKEELQQLRIKQIYIGIITHSEADARQMESRLLDKCGMSVEVTFHRTNGKIALEGDSRIGNDLVLATDDVLLIPPLFSRYRLVQSIILVNHYETMTIFGRGSERKSDWTLDGLVKEAVSEGPLSHLYRAMRQLKFQEFIAQ